MITNLDPSAESFILNVDKIQQRIADANNQITSGKKLNVASDAPDQVDALLQARADELHNTQIKSNLGLAQTDAQAADDALTSSIQLMDRATQLGAQGANATQTADSRTTIAGEVSSLLDQMVSNSQTRVSGRYIFSGDQDSSLTYQIDLEAPKGVDQLSNAAATRRIEDPAGGSFQASMTAQQIFDTTNGDGTPASNNVFNALNSLRTSLLNNDQNGIDNALASVKLASTHLNNMQSFYGTVENRLQDATSFASNYDTQLQTQVSGIQDADVTASALELTQANTQLQAAFQSRAELPKTSLFSFLG